MAVSMVPNVSVVVIRDGKRVKPTIGKSFDFTKEERDALIEAQPNSLRKASGDEDGNDEALSGATPVPSAEASQAKARGGKKVATAAKSDEEVAQDEDL